MVVQMDSEELAQMAEEIAALLRKYVPGGETVALRSETTKMRSKTCTQVFAFSPEQGGIFSVNAELRHPPPGQGNLDVKCT
jgi:hypothetical protein